MMQRVHAPAALPTSPGTARPLSRNVPSPVANVLTGNAAAVVLPCLSVPRSAARQLCTPWISIFAAAALPSPCTLRVEQALPASTSGLLGSAAPDHEPPAQLVVKLSDQLSSTPTSRAARS